MKISIETFSRVFVEEYETLYQARGYVAGTREAVEAFDEFLEAHGDFVGEFANYRGDHITSDREAAAFMLALDRMGAIG